MNMCRTPWQIARRVLCRVSPYSPTRGLSLDEMLTAIEGNLTYDNDLVKLVGKLDIYPEAKTKFSRIVTENYDRIIFEWS